MSAPRSLNGSLTASLKSEVLMPRGTAASLLVCTLIACAPTDSDTPMAADRGPTIVENVIYGQKLGMALTLDVLQPAIQNGAGVIFLNSAGYGSPSVHFVTGDGESVRIRSTDEMGDKVHYSAQPLVDAGYTIFNVRHGSSPLFQIPEIVDDVRRAVRFVRDHASEYGVDSSRLGAWGGSAGGHLALMLGTTSEVPASGSADTIPAPLAAVVAYYPPSELTSLRIMAEERAKTNGGMGLVEAYPAFGFPEERDPEFSPYYAATADDAPTLILHGDRDSVVPLEQGAMMHRALVAAGVVAELVVVEGSPHVFSGDNALLALESTVTWFDKHLR